MLDSASDEETFSGNSENSRETEGISEQRPTSCATLFRLFVISPYLFSLKTSHPILEDSFNLLVSVEKRLELFFSNYQRIWDIRISDVLKLLWSGVNEVIEFYAGDAAWQHLSKYVIHTHMMVLEILDRVDRLLGYVVPSEPDVQPLYNIATAGLSIRKKCYYILRNFFNRSVHKLIVSTDEWLSYFKDPKSNEKVLLNIKLIYEIK